MAVEGSITIGIGAKTDEFDKKIADLENKMKKEEDKGIEIQAKINIKESSLNELREQARPIKAQMEQISKEIAEIEAKPKVTVAEYNRYGPLVDTYNQLNHQMNDLIAKNNVLQKGLESLRSKQSQINDKVSEYKQKIENVKLQKQVSDVEKLKASFNSVGSSIESSIKKVGRLALGIFGIRSAYMALRRASSDLASYDQQYATNLEYIRYALTQAIAPVLQWIVSLAAKLLGYINAIMQGWFGINLFARGSAENFNKMKAGAGGVAKAVKEIKKQLAGFDEINMLTDKSDTGTSAGAGGVGMPDFDLSALQGEPPKWLQWIIDNKDLILSVLAGIAGGLVAIKLGASGIQALGIGLMITGIVYAIQALLEYLKDPSWENFGKIIQGIGIAIVGLGILIGNVPLIIVGAIVLIVGTIIKHWEEIKAFFQRGIDWLSDKSDWVHKMFGDTIGNIYDTFVKNLQLILNWFDMTFKNIKQIFDGIIQFVKGVFTGNWQQAWEGIKKIFGAIWDWIKNTVLTILDIVWNIFSNIIDTIGNAFKWLWQSIKDGAQNAWNWITGIFGNIANWFGNIISTIVNKFRDMGTRVGEVISNAFKSVVNGVLKAIENILNSPIRAINGLIGVINAVPGINLSTLPTFNLPRLKVGAIINMPNKGTLVGGGSAIGGESGREGIIPLTDQQAMAELGAEIGRNVVVNLTNITKVGNRQIARELKTINAEQEFAFNS